MPGPAITATGQISSLGPTVEASCAAHRAGLLRLSPVEGLTTYDPEELEGPILGAQIPDLTEGFFHTARWVLLAERALTDLFRNLGASPGDKGWWSRAVLLWILPIPDFERFRIPEEVADEVLRSCCTEVLLPILRSPLPRESVQLLPYGPSGLALACLRARELLEGARASRVVILATDSLLDPLSLMQALEDDRLKHASQPLGFYPGEGGACALFEGGGEEGTSSRIRGVGIAEWPQAADELDPTAWRTANAPSLGAALAQAIHIALREAAIPLPFRGDLVLDLNGESWRGLAWGHAQVLLQEAIDLAGCRIVLPAASYGELGAVGPVVGLCLARAARLRGYATSGQALLMSLSERGTASALLMEGP